MRRFDARTHQRGAQRRLQRFRQGTALAIAITALLLLVWGDPLEGEASDAVEANTTTSVAQPRETAPPDGAGTEPSGTPPAETADAVDEATGTIRELAVGFYALLPRVAIVLVLIGAALMVSRVGQAVLRRSLHGWQRVEGASALMRLIVSLLAVASLSVLAGDARAVVGSVGLLGLAASWALQTPIESFTGWLLNSFRGYYRVGDRIAVGDVFGDVYRIDILTTTVWEAGGPGKPVAAAQSTGALITFPNWEVLRSNIVNYSRDFPYVWDEVTVGVSNESDLAYAARVLEGVARRVLGEEMTVAAQRYQELLEAERLAFGVEEVPQVYLSPAASWTDCTIRYVVPVRTRRRWATALLMEASRELARPAHAGRIGPAYPRTEVRLRQHWSADLSQSGLPGTPGQERPD